MKKLLLLLIILVACSILITKYNLIDLFVNNFLDSNKKEETIKPVKKNITTNISAKGYLLRGKEKFKIKNYKGAIIDFTKAIKKDSEYIEAYRLRALAKDAIKDYVGSKEDYEYVIYLESGKNDLHNKEKYNQMMIIVKKGNQFFKEQKYHDAIFEYNIAISSYPSFSEPYIRKADTNFVLKNYNEALNDYNNALKSDMNNKYLYLKRANTKYMLKQYKSAIEDYKIYSKEKTNQANVYYKIAGAYIFLEDFDNAYTNLNKYDCLTKTKTVKVDDYNKWNAILDKYTTNEKIRDIKFILKKLELVK